MENGVLEADVKQRLPGRGWYVCRQPACLSLLQNLKKARKVFGRSLEIGPVLTNRIMMPPAGEDYAQSKSL